MENLQEWSPARQYAFAQVTGHGSCGARKPVLGATRTRSRAAAQHFAEPRVEPASADRS
jgi:hypothetical protein